MKVKNTCANQSSPRIVIHQTVKNLKTQKLSLLKIKKKDLSPTQFLLPEMLMARLCSSSATRNLRQPAFVVGFSTFCEQLHFFVFYSASGSGLFHFQVYLFKRTAYSLNIYKTRL